MQTFNLLLNQKHDGFYFHAPTGDYFFITSKKIKSTSLVNTIDQILKEDGCTYRGLFGGFALSQLLKKSTVEKKECGAGNYYVCRGDGFSFGDLEKNRVTKIFKLD